jgi:hypothetical protein
MVAESGWNTARPCQIRTPIAGSFRTLDNVLRSHSLPPGSGLTVTRPLVERTSAPRALTLVPAARAL